MDGIRSSEIIKNANNELNIIDEITLARERIRDLENQVYDLKSKSPELLKRVEHLRKFHEDTTLLRDAIYSSVFPTFIIDNDDRFMMVNPVFLDAFSRKNMKIEELPVSQVFPQVFATKLADMRACCDGTGNCSEVFELEWESEGRIKLYDMWLYPVIGEDHRPIAISGTAVDITDQRIAEFKLRESEEKFRVLVEETDNLVLQLDPDLRVLFANHASRDLLSLAPESCVGLPVLDFVHAEDIDLLERRLYSSINDNSKNVTLETRLSGMDGQQRYILWSFNLVYDSEGFLIYINCIARDISKRKHLEMQLVKARDTAEAADRSKSEFLAMMSHEIRTPLNSIIGLSELMLDMHTEGEQTAMLETIRSSGLGLLNLINDILDISKVEAGQLKFDQQPIHVRECMEQIRRTFAYRAEQKDLAYSISVDEDVPTIILGDRERIVQILNNLVGNALKFTHEGHVKIRVSVSALANVEELDLWQGGNVQNLKSFRISFEIEDTGIGISDEQKHLMFLPFSQADDTIRKRFGGTGLGLTICKKLAVAMHGDIAFKSEFGKGSQFILSLNVQGGDGLEVASHESGSKAILKLNRELAKEYPLNILVADDVSHNRLVMKTLLQRMGYNPVIVDNGESAVDEVMNQPIDLIFMDLLMPGMGGLDASRAIRHRQNTGQLGKRPIHIVALTANAMQDDQDECYDAGMDGFMAKPVRFQIVQETIIEAASALEDNP